MKHSIETQRDWQNDLKVKREIKISSYLLMYVETNRGNVLIASEPFNISKWD